MKTKYSVRLIILLILMGLLISGFVTLGLFLIYKSILSHTDLMIGLSGFFFIWIGLGHYLMIASSIKSIEFRNELLIIRKPLVRKYYEIELAKIKYLDFEWQSTWCTMKGIHIQIDNDFVEKIANREYRNSNDFIDLITKTCKRDDSIKIRIWTKTLRLFLAIGVSIMIGFILLRITK